MADKKTVRVLRMNSIKSDGTPNTNTIEMIVKDPINGQEILEEDGTGAVVVELRALTKEEHDEIIREFTTHEKSTGGRGLVERVDHRGVDDEILRRCIKGWRGLAGSDDKPLVCTNATKVLIDPFLKLQVQRKLFGAEAVEVAAESFR